MKKRITKIWGIGLIVALLASLLMVATPAAAIDNLWEAELTPAAPLYQIYPGTNVADFDVYGEGDEIWAVNGTDNFTYKSVDGGTTWVKGNTTALPIIPDLIAVAPDNASVIAVADASVPKVYITTNGGMTWSPLPTISADTSVADFLTDMDVSGTSLGTNYMAVSGYDGSVGDVWFFNAGAAAPYWYSAKSKSNFLACTKVHALAFSPNFPSDLVMVAVSDNTVAVQFQIMSYSGAPSTWSWNSAPFPTQYPVELCSITGAVAKASIALDPEYLGSDDILRNSFTGLSLAASTDLPKAGVYRLLDVVKKQIQEGVNVYSVNYNGTTCVSGVDGSTTVWRSADPMASIPTFYPSSSLKSPGGNDNTIVAYGGTDLYAGTSGTNSAFAVSRNDGKSFNDLSLIDTNLNAANDVATTEDGSMVYWTTHDTTSGYFSLWRKAPTWERVLTAAATGFIIRMAPDDPDVLYVADVGGNDVYYTKDGGDEKWFTRNCSVGGNPIADFAVESSDVAYALGGSSVVKTTNSGFTWGPPTDTKLSSGYSITLAAEDNLMVGSQNGFVSYSTDGNASWTMIVKQITGAANVIVTADADYANNNTIYTATNSAGRDVMKWVIGTSTVWEDTLLGSFGTKEGVYGLTIQGGVLYALIFDTSDNQSALWQCLTPTLASYTWPAWDSTKTTAATDTDDAEVWLGINSSSPNALAGSTGSNKMWACKTNGTNKLYGYNDVLAGAGPAIVAPADEYSNPVNAVTGKANEIAFSWPRLSNATEYSMWIAYDAGFAELVTAVTFASTTPTAVVAVGPDRKDAQLVNFMPGTTYYWRAKATAPLSSPWSEVRSFTIEPGAALVPVIGSPANGAKDVSANPAFSWTPVSGTTTYEFQLAVSPSMVSPLFTATVAETGIRPAVKLDPGMTYFWRVRALEPVTGDWSTIANFMVAEEVVEKPPVVVEQVPPPQITIETPPPPPEIVIPPAPAPPAPITPAYIWAIVIIGAILVIAVIVLIVRTRRTV